MHSRTEIRGLIYLAPLLEKESLILNKYIVSEFFISNVTKFSKFDKKLYHTP